MYDKLAFGICWYNDPSIFRLLDSLPKEATKFVIDGRFLWNPAETALSSVILRKKVRKTPNTVIIDAPDLTEPDKRQKYLDAMAEGGYQYCFIIDSDEYIINADWNRFYQRCLTIKEGIHYIQFKKPSNEGILLYPRLWITPSEWVYHKGHALFRNIRTRQIFSSGSAGTGTFKTVLCGIDDSLRSQQWLDDTSKYQEKLWAHEANLKKEVYGTV